MSHDPLCPNSKTCGHTCEGCSCHLDVFCQCDLIAQVRDDERAQLSRRQNDSSDGARS